MSAFRLYSSNNYTRIVGKSLKLSSDGTSWTVYNMYHIVTSTSVVEYEVYSQWRH